MSDPTTVIAGIKGHLAQIEQKMEDIYTEHMPAVREFVHTLESNPLVTAFASSIPGGELGADAMAILNGLAPLLGALGGKITHPDPVTLPVVSAVPVAAPAATGSAAAIPPAQGSADVQ